MKQGALIFDEQTDRYDIRFDLADGFSLAFESAAPSFHLPPTISSKVSPQCSPP